MTFLLKITKGLLILSLTIGMFVPVALASENFYRGEVLEVISEEIIEEFGTSKYQEDLKVELLEGPDAGEIIRVTYINSFITDGSQKIEEGGKVVVVESVFGEKVIYSVYEPYRLPNLALLFGLFVVIILFIGGKRGFSSLIGLAVTLLVLIKWIIPNIVAGGNPLLFSFVGALIIVCVSLYLAHGFNKRTSLALVSTLITLQISLVLALLSVYSSKLFGLGSEDAAYLAFGSTDSLDFRGLLLGAIVIGALGVLDDVTTTQTATIYELHKLNPKLPFHELYKRGLSVGKEHIASLVNTLVLAYVGAAFPALLVLTMSSQPLWVLMNNEFMAEEIVRTLVGSSTLVLAVPISTALAAYAYRSKIY
ncbi:YibE/F family protein [Candidatus Peregrinibacteria bacterium]|jgi:uncharacterized membrane protein|nr:YibE/F family protein [Candidatus Peregrinibacteria bacterium]MBT7702846.1 YibE/F family protein [Candidatus Peregrinibacteria bacterium]